jgi:hypothetical protein
VATGSRLQRDEEVDESRGRQTNWTLIEDRATSWRLTSEIKLHFPKEGRPVVQEVKTIKEERKRQ